jgi:hypothetical protein
VHLTLLDLTPLHRRPQRPHALRDDRSENEANQHPHKLGVGCVNDLGQFLWLLIKQRSLLADGG